MSQDDESNVSKWLAEGINKHKKIKAAREDELKALAEAAQEFAKILQECGGDHKLAQKKFARKQAMRNQ